MLQIGHAIDRNNDSVMPRIRVAVVYREPVGELIGRFCSFAQTKNDVVSRIVEIPRSVWTHDISQRNPNQSSGMPHRQKLTLVRIDSATA